KAGDERAVQRPGPGGQLTLSQTGRELVEACVDRLDIGIGIGDGPSGVGGDIGPFGAEAVIPLALVVGGLGQGAGEIAQMGDALVDTFEDVLVADLRRGGDGGRMRNRPTTSEVAAGTGSPALAGAAHRGPGGAELPAPRQGLLQPAVGFVGVPRRAGT